MNGKRKLIGLSEIRIKKEMTKKGNKKSKKQNDVHGCQNEKHETLKQFFRIRQFIMHLIYANQ